ncbi:hypothetical protein ABPG74_009904 [Tetrahymena malaccensis]
MVYFFIRFFWQHSFLFFSLTDSYFLIYLLTSNNNLWIIRRCESFRVSWLVISRLEVSNQSLQLLYKFAFYVIRLSQHLFYSFNLIISKTLFLFQEKQDFQNKNKLKRKIKINYHQQKSKQYDRLTFQEEHSYFSYFDFSNTFLYFSKSQRFSLKIKFIQNARQSFYLFKMKITKLIKIIVEIFRFNSENQARLLVIKTLRIKQFTKIYVQGANKVIQFDHKAIRIIQIRQSSQSNLYRINLIHISQKRKEIKIRNYTGQIDSS